MGIPWASCGHLVGIPDRLATPDPGEMGAYLNAPPRGNGTAYIISLPAIKKTLDGMRASRLSVDRDTGRNPRNATGRDLPPIPLPPLPPPFCTSSSGREKIAEAGKCICHRLAKSNGAVTVVQASPVSVMGKWNGVASLPPRKQMISFTSSSPLILKWPRPISSRRDR